MSPSPQQTLAQTLGIATSLTASGAILSISAFLCPLLDASARSIPTTSTPSPTPSLQGIRFLFSRGSHVFPQAATLASACFLYLARDAPTSAAVVDAFGFFAVTARGGYVAAAVFTTGILPFTVLGMLPAANRRLRELAALEEKGKGGEVDGGELEALVQRFKWLNYVRGGLIGVGGGLGLLSAVS